MDDAAVTASGLKQLEFLAASVSNFASILMAQEYRVLTGRANRAIQTAGRLATELSCDAEVYAQLDSLVINTLAGRSIVETTNGDVVMARELNLSKAGLLNNYQMRDLAGVLPGLKPSFMTF